MKCTAYKANPGPVVKADRGRPDPVQRQPRGLLSRAAVAKAKAGSAIAANGISVNMDMFKLTRRA
jgi:hypothetical protein